MENEKRKTTAVGVRIPDDVIAQVKVKAERINITFSQWVVKAIKEKLNK